jgi:hypothetical protein
MQDFQIRIAEEIDRGLKFVRTSIAIRRLRLLAEPSVFKALQSDILKGVEKVKTAYAAFKEVNMVDSQGNETSYYKSLFDDLEWVRTFIEFEEGIEQIERAVKDPIYPLPDARMALIDPFPMVFGSMTVPTYPVDVHIKEEAFQLSERLATATMILGKDIQQIFVPADKIESVQKLFAEAEIEVAVTDLDVLERTANIYKALSPYLAKVVRK